MQPWPTPAEAADVRAAIAAGYSQEVIDAALADEKQSGEHCAPWRKCGVCSACCYELYDAQYEAELASAVISRTLQEVAKRGGPR